MGRARRVLVTLAGFILVSGIVAAQSTVAVSGHAKLPDNTAPTDKTFVRFQLIGASNCQARVDGSTLLSDYHKDYNVDGTGAISGVIIPNVNTVPASSIDCNGTLGQTQYAVTLYVNNRPNGKTINYIVGPGAFNLDTAQPAVTDPAIVTPTALLANPQGNQAVAQPVGTTFSVNSLTITGRAADVPAPLYPSGPSPAQ
jgi:hypothetical protein